MFLDVFCRSRNSNIENDKGTFVAFRQELCSRLIRLILGHEEQHNINYLDDCLIFLHGDFFSSLRSVRAKSVWID